MNTFLRSGSKALIMLMVLVLSVSLIHAQSGSGSSTEINEIPELVFRNGTLLSGTAGKEGAIYLFKNVATGFDATITLKKFSDKNIYMKNIDNTDFGWDKAFQPEFGMSSVKANQNWYIDFELTFLEAGTTNKKKADRFTVTSLDVDGDGGNVKEYVTMEKASSVTYSTISYLLNGNPTTNILPTCCECSKQSAAIVCMTCLGTGQVPKPGSKKTQKCTACDGVGKVYSLCKHSYCGEDATAQGPIDNFTNIDTASTSVMATYVYNNKETVNFRIGATSGSKNGGAGVRLNSLWFKAFSLAPHITLPVRLSAFSAFYNNSSVMLNWQTTEEQNFSHFIIERSEDGKVFTESAIVFAARSSKGADYVYKDSNTGSSSTGMIYYRLKSVDQTKEVSYSSIRSIKLRSDVAQGITLNAYPNPLVSEVKLTLPYNWQGKKVLIEVVSSNGQKVHAVGVVQASQTETLQLPSLSKGFYVLKASCENQTVQQTVVKN